MSKYSVIESSLHKTWIWVPEPISWLAVGCFSVYPYPFEVKEETLYFHTLNGVGQKCWRLSGNFYCWTSQNCSLMLSVKDLLSVYGMSDSILTSPPYFSRSLANKTYIMLMGLTRRSLGWFWLLESFPRVSRVIVSGTVLGSLYFPVQFSPEHPVIFVP